MNHSFNKYLLVLAFLTIMAVPLVQSMNCKLGEVRINNVCDSPKAIEGCIRYKSKTQCDLCQFSYVNRGGICEFKKPEVNQKCCEDFDFNGQCKRCCKGFYLDHISKQCIDYRIPGCLQKSERSEICINCAKQFILINGICFNRIPSCIEYRLNGVQIMCNKCSENYFIMKGECSRVNIQANCVAPFIKNYLNRCAVPNCKLDYQFGCYQCEINYELTLNRECARKRITGCVNYISQIQCKTCEDYSYELIKGICYPVGCSELNTRDNMFVCIRCDTLSGYTMLNGICKIPYCLLSRPNGCYICQEGRIWYQGKCVLESQIERTACISCAATQFLNQRKQCQQRDEGCISYIGNSCAECDSNYVFDSVLRKCTKKLQGCLYNNQAQCYSCQANYQFSQGRCIITGCLSYNQQFRCTDCSSEFRLTNLGFCVIENCLQISSQGCTGCQKNYTLNRGRCVLTDINCAARNINDKCVGCKEGFYLDAMTNFCQKSNFGCNYIDGLCTSCKTPFIYNPKTLTCFIDGCQKYFFGGCEVCVTGYSLRYNSCKLPNCLVSNNGLCLECDPNYIMKSMTNKCIDKDQFCLNYNKQGKCIQCASKYFMSRLQDKCLPGLPGCIYDSKDQCKSCIEPFKPLAGQNRCYLVGCLQANFDSSCSQCKYPFEFTDRKLCTIKNCLRNDDNKCIQCIDSFIIENGICSTGDPYCTNYNYKTGKCLNCRQGYKIVQNRCQYADANCLIFTQDGNCANCINSFYLNQYKMCQMRDPKCQEYVNGRCNRCKPLHYLHRQICYQNNKGCLIQESLNICSKCETGYKLDKNSRCQFQITRLDWNSVDMNFQDFFDNKQQKQLIKEIFTAGKQNKQNLVPSLKQRQGKLFYSSDINNIKEVHVYSTILAGWNPRTDINEFVGVEVPNRETFYAIQIQCMPNNKMTQLSIQYLDKQAWKQIGLYNLFCESAGTIKTIFITPVETTSLRLVSKKGIANIKIQFYYNDRNYKVESKKIQSSIQKTITDSIQASYQLLANYCNSKQLCWFGLQISEPKTINGFEIVYNTKSKSLGTINSVYLDYSVDGIKFTCIDECKAFKVNEGVFILEKPVFGSKMRVHITSYTGKPAIRIQFNYQ